MDCDFLDNGVVDVFRWFLVYSAKQIEQDLLIWFSSDSFLHVLNLVEPIQQMIVSILILSF